MIADVKQKHHLELQIKNFSVSHAYALQSICLLYEIYYVQNFRDNLAKIYPDKLFPPSPISMLRFDEKCNMSCAIKPIEPCDGERGFRSNFQSCLVIFGQDCAYSSPLYAYNFIFIDILCNWSYSKMDFIYL